jgi:hypothetical protein
VWAEEFGGFEPLFGDETPPDPRPQSEARIKQNVLSAVRAGRRFVVAEAMGTIFDHDIRGKAGAKHALPRPFREDLVVRSP